MRKTMSALLFALCATVFTAPVVAAAPTPSSDEPCLRLDKVRDFVRVSEDEVLVRQAVSNFRSIRVANCPTSAPTDWLSFGFYEKASTVQVYGGKSGYVVPVTSNMRRVEFCSSTENDYILLRDNFGRNEVSCEIVGVALATEEEFRAAKPSK